MGYLGVQHSCDDRFPLLKRSIRLTERGGVPDAEEGVVVVRHVAG